MYDKSGALAQFAQDVNPAAVELDYLIDDGKSQSGSPDLAGAGLIHLIEPVKDVGDILFGDTDALVRDGDADVLLLLIQARCV